MYTRKKGRKPEGIRATLAIPELQEVQEVEIGQGKLQENCLNCHLMIVIYQLQKICFNQIKFFKINKRNLIKSKSKVFMIKLTSNKYQSKIHKI